MYWQVIYFIRQQIHFFLHLNLNITLLTQGSVLIYFLLLVPWLIFLPAQASEIDFVLFFFIFALWLVNRRLLVHVHVPCTVVIVITRFWLRQLCVIFENIQVRQRVTARPIDIGYFIYYRIVGFVAILGSETVVHQNSSIYDCKWALWQPLISLNFFLFKREAKKRSKKKFFFFSFFLTCVLKVLQFCSYADRFLDQQNCTNG